MDKYPNIVILLSLPQVYIPKAEFVLRTFCYVLRLHPTFVYGKHYEGAHIYYGPSTLREYPIKIHFDITTAEFFEKRELYPLDEVNFSQYKKEYIPFLFSRPGAIFSFNPENASFRKDIVASAFYFLTCWHEYIITYHGNRRGRIDFRQSLQYRWDFTEVPIVDVYCQMLLYAMEIAIPQFIREIVWNSDKRFAISLSHDIDYWDYWAAGQKISSLKYNLQTFLKRPINASYKIFGHTVHKNLIHNPQRQTKWILRKENKLGVKSTWFLFGKDDFEDSRQNYIADSKIRRILLDLLQGQEVGLHGSPDSAYDPIALNKELDNLRSAGFNVTGYRSHYLNFDYQKSFQILEAAGIKYDSTLGYWENVGFRAGISLPFYPFNIEENRPFRVLEIPLIAMDTTLFSKKAMDFTPSEAYRKMSRMITTVANYQSHLSLLWHNTSFDPIDYPLWGSIYWKLVRNAQNKGAWVTSLYDIYSEWQDLS